MTDRLLPYQQAVALLKQYDIPLAPGCLVSAPAEAIAAAESFGLPVALKAISPGLTHKSDAGLVHLNLTTPAEVETAARMLLAAAPHDLEGLLVQRMVSTGIEMMVGLTRDPQFGPVIALGSGGVLVELLDDVVLRLPPITHIQAAGMIQETRSWKLFQGFRGRPPADGAALAQLLIKTSNLAVEQAGRIVSLDLNPVMVLPAGQGVQVVDLRIVVAGPIEKENQR